MSYPEGTGPEYTFFGYMGIASALVFASKYQFTHYRSPKFMNKLFSTVEL